MSDYQLNRKVAKMTPPRLARLASILAALFAASVIVSAPPAYANNTTFTSQFTKAARNCAYTVGTQIELDEAPTAAVRGFDASTGKLTPTPTVQGYDCVTTAGGSPGPQAIALGSHVFLWNTPSYERHNDDADFWAQTNMYGSSFPTQVRFAPSARLRAIANGNVTKGIFFTNPA